MKKFCIFVLAYIAYLALNYTILYALYIITLPLQFVETIVKGLLQ